MKQERLTSTVCIQSCSKKNCRTKNCPTQKRSFLLLEALVSIALLAGTLFLFFHMQSGQAKLFQDMRRHREAERFSNIALSTLIEKMHQKGFEFDLMKKGGSSLPVELQAGQTSPPWRAIYSFSLCPEDREAELTGQALRSCRIDVTITLLPPDNSAPIVSTAKNRFCLQAVT